MDINFEGLSVTLSEDDISTLKDRISQEKSEWMKAAQNDEEFVAELSRSAEGKVYSSVERWLKKATGISFENISADLKGGERYKEMLNLALDSIRSTKDQTNQELQEKLLEAKEHLRVIREEEIPKIEESYKSKFNEKNIEGKLSEIIEKQTIVDGRLTPAKIYTKAVLKDRYKLGWNDSENSVMIKTHKDLLPVLNDKTATLDDVIISVLNEGGFIQHSNGTKVAVDANNNSAPVKKSEWNEQARKFAEANGIEL